MSGHNLIDHFGIIEQIEDDVALVKINSESACAACHAKGVCGAADQEEKYLDIPLHGVDYNKGEPVHVQVARHLGFRAVALGYIYPFLLLMAVLISLTAFGANELRAGIFALLSLLPYYLILFLLRKRIKTTFTFSMKKIQTVQ
ncbi:MAG: SoxR reducing system RseC family protein [Bacteroidales bacterium]|nr:SoxR reducing system RseC family protein [Bacteroidales bacterium]